MAWAAWAATLAVPAGAAAVFAFVPGSHMETGPQRPRRPAVPGQRPAEPRRAGSSAAWLPARRARLCSARAARVSRPAARRACPALPYPALPCPAGRVRRAGAGSAAHPRPRPGWAAVGGGGPGSAARRRAGSGGGGGEGVGEGGSHSSTLLSSLPLGTPASDLRRCRDRVLHRPVLWEVARGPGHGDPRAPRGQQAPHRVSTGRRSPPRAGEAPDGDSGRAGRRAAVPSLRPACLASLRGAELAAASRCRRPARSEHGPGTVRARRGAGGGRAGSSGAERSGAGESACFAFALREGHPGPATGAAPPAERAESRFGPGLVPFGSWFGAALRHEGQPLLAAPDPGQRGWKGRWRGGSRGRGGSGEPPRPQRFSPSRPSARAPGRSCQKPLKGLFSRPSRGSQPHRTAAAEEGRALPTANWKCPKLSEIGGRPRWLLPVPPAFGDRHRSRSTIAK